MNYSRYMIGKSLEINGHGPILIGLISKGLYKKGPIKKEKDQKTTMWLL